MTTYILQIIDRDKSSNKVRIHFIGYSFDFDEWRDTTEVAEGEESTKLCSLAQWFEPSVDSLSDKTDAFFYNLAKAVKVSLYSSNRELPAIRIEGRIDADNYNGYLKNTGVVNKFKGKNVHVVSNNNEISRIMGKKWFQRIINTNGDFCYVVRDTVRFWLNEKRPVKDFFYVGDHLFENQIRNDLQLIFTFVRGDGVKDK